MSVLISAGALQAQSLKVVYREQIKTPGSVKELTDPAVAAAVAGQLNRMNRAMVLYCEKGESFFCRLPEENSGQSGFQDNIQVIQAGAGSYYKNLKKNESVSQEFIMDKAFLITEPLHSGWTLLPGEKPVGGYLCKEAVNERNITAWYCPDIPAGDGPYLFCGLPGLILEIETPAKTVRMESIDWDAGIKDEIKIPAKGKKISRSEFDKLLAEKKKELGADGKKSVTVIKM
jgi:GLPGLI family protein